MAFLEALVIGAVLGFSLAAPPGPVLAQLAFETARGRWQKGLLVGLGATSADATFFLLVWLGLLRVVPSDTVLAVMALAGAGLMAFFSWNAWKAARRPFEVRDRMISGFPGGYLLAALSPFNIGWWLTAGVTFLELHGASLALGFFLAILGVVVASVLIVRFAAARIERFETWVAYASAVFLLGFGAFLVHHAETLLRGA